MKLSELIRRVSPLEVSGEAAGVEIKKIEYDSRKVQAGTLFVAVRGFKADGHQFIVKAMSQGAVAVMCEEIPAINQTGNSADCIYIKVADTRIALAQIAKAFYGDASEKLVIIGVTGTNGKTTTAALIKSILDANDLKAGLIGTIAYEIGDEKTDAHHTTPEALELHQLFSKMVDAGCKAVVMEVSSHSLTLKRTHGINFKVAVFTNLTLDHLDFHGTMENYFAAKRLLFDELGAGAVAVTNADDAYGQRLVERTKAKVITYAVEETMDAPSDTPSLLKSATQRADMLAKVFSYKLDGTTAVIATGDEAMMHHFKLIGKFNAYNMMAAYSVGAALGLSRVDIMRGMMKCDAVRGRLEQVWSADNRCAIVDYSHTPDALANAIRAIKQIKPESGKLITVFGCGGDRDKTKRPVMGKIASEESDVVIITSDNPRTENPETILDEIEAGIEEKKQFYRIAEREQAIRKAITLLGRGDVALVAGKGHETYQEINGVRSHFDDKEIIEKVFREQELAV